MSCGGQRNSRRRRRLLTATWRRRGFSNSSRISRPRRPERTGGARRRSRNCSYIIIRLIDADTGALQLARACHQSWQGRGRGSQRSSAFAVYPVACRQPRTAAGRRQALCAARGDRRDRCSTGKGPSTTGKCHDPQIHAALAESKLPTLPREGSGPGAGDYPALRTLCGAAPVTKRSGKSHIVLIMRATRRTSGCATWCIIGPASPRSTTPKAASVTPRCAGAANRMAARLRGVATLCSRLCRVPSQRQTPFDPTFAEAKCDRPQPPDGETQSRP